MFLLFFTGCQSNLDWTKQLDQVTIHDSWLTWQNYYSSQSENFISYKSFKNALTRTECEDISPSSFLLLNIENHRLNHCYKNLQSAEDAYPSQDRPRGEKDINSVNYFLERAISISPILVAKFKDKSKKLRFVKLDGVHRLVAAFILSSPIRLCWIDLTNNVD